MTLLPRFGLTLVAALALAACSSEAPNTANTDVAPAAPVAETTGAPANPANPADTATGDAAAFSATQGNGSETLVRTPGPIVAPNGPVPVAGVDYIEIPGGQPFQPSNGKIEVVEVFGYTCPACAQFEPQVTAWAAKLPEDVQFTPLAAPFGGYWMPFAKGFYAAQATGLLAKSHDAMFNAIHLERTLSPDSSDDQVAQFYSRFGADPKKFASTMASFSVKAKMGRAQQFLQRTGVDSTPTMVVDGKYRITGQSWDQNLDIAEHLIAAERAAKPTPQADADADSEAPADEAAEAQG